MSASSSSVMQMEKDFSAHNYHPLPVVCAKGEGVYVWDPEGKKYFDFLSAYSALNQGHSHPKLIAALCEQAQRLSLSSRAFYNDQFGLYAKFVTEYFGFESVLPMNTGAEGVETALKLSRRWGYRVKNIPEDQAIIISCTGCFHGRTIGVISLCDDESMWKDFGPRMPGVITIEYDDVDALRRVLEEHGERVCGFLVEPIQGEAGVRIPHDGYLRQAFDLCKKHNVLFIADEIQSGIARTGKLLACDYDEVKPDVLILGKALSGGMYPVSAVLSSKAIMDTIKAGDHGSTYGGNPIACAVAIAALEIVRDEKLAERAFELGEKLRAKLRAIDSPIVMEVRGKGLLNAMVIDHKAMKCTAWDVCLLLKDRGLLAKPTHDFIIRFAPPLSITEEQLDECVSIIAGTLRDVVKMTPEEIPGHELQAPHEQPTAAPARVRELCE